MEGQGDGRCSGYRIPLDLGGGEPNLRFRRFCISLHNDEISFIIEAAPRQPQNDSDNNEDDANLQNIVNEVNIEDDDGAIPEDSDSENDLGDGDSVENNEEIDSDGQNEDSESDLMLDDNDELYNFVNARDQYAWIRFIWQAWPFSCGNIFEEIVFEFHGIREEDLAIRDHDLILENPDDDNYANALNNDHGNDANVEDAANDSGPEVGVNQALQQVDEHPLPQPLPLPLSLPLALPLPVPAIPNVRSKVEEIDEEAFRWWHEFDYNFSESAGVEVDEEDPLPAGCDKKTRENTQDVKRDRKSGLLVFHEMDPNIKNSDLVQKASEEGENIPCFSEQEAEALPGPSRKRSREEAGLNQGRRSNKRFCRRSDCDGKTSDSNAEDTLSSGATKRS